VQRRITQQTAAAEAAKDAAAAAAAAVAVAGKKKGGRGKKGASAAGAGDENAEDIEAMAALDAKQTQARVANATFPEYQLLDLLYVMSYDPSFVDRLPVVSGIHHAPLQRASRR
jgi:hypothetical protein